MEMVNLFRRGDIIIADLEPVEGSEQGCKRPVLIIQNNIYNEYSPVIIVAAITSKTFKKDYPTNVHILRNESGLDRDSTILLNQLRTIDKSRIDKKVSSLDKYFMDKVDLAIKTSLDLK
jgi:mRNA interferase MazF